MDLAEKELLRGLWMSSAAGVHNARGTEREGWVYRSPQELVLKRGRIFDYYPAPPEAVGTPGECVRDANAYANQAPDAVYVEGYAVEAGLASLLGMYEHAWCARGDTVIDPTWSAPAAYVGVPFTDAIRHEQHGAGGITWSPPFSLLKQGLPDAGTVNIGRPIPDVETWLPPQLRDLTVDLNQGQAAAHDLAF